jgi:hypothetical protein
MAELNFAITNSDPHVPPQTGVVTQRMISALQQHRAIKEATH